jgi:hypothetical protein
VVDEAGAGLTSRGEESESTGVTPSGCCGGVEWGGAGTLNEASSVTKGEFSCMNTGGCCDSDEFARLGTFHEISSSGVGQTGRTLLSDEGGPRFELEISTVESGRGDTCERLE